MKSARIAALLAEREGGDPECCAAASQPLRQHRCRGAGPVFPRDSGPAIRRRWLVACLIFVAAVIGGCGEPAQREGAEIDVTRDYGAERIGSIRQETLAPGETAMRLLQRDFDVETRYGGGSVQSIEGRSGGRRRGRSTDWFLYVNGIESDNKAASRRLVGGERVWWDLHDRDTVMRVPAVVGSFPEPFLTGIAGKRRPIRVDCADDADRHCDEVTARLGEAGVDAVARGQVNGPAGAEVFRIVVGTWSKIRIDPTIRHLEREPRASGVFARFADEGARLRLLDERGRIGATLGSGSGLVAATRFEGQQPTWVVTGTDSAGVAAAAAVLHEEALAQRFEVAVTEGQPVALPVRTDLAP